MLKRYDTTPINLRVWTSTLFAAWVALAGHAAYAQKPPPPPVKGKNYPMAKEDRIPPARIIQLNPGQKKVDPKSLKTAPTVHQFVKAKSKSPKARPVQRQISPAPQLPVGKSAGVVRPTAPARLLTSPPKPKQ